MATVREWHHEMDRMEMGELHRLRAHLADLCDWRMFAREFKGVRQLCHEMERHLASRSEGITPHRRDTDCVLDETNTCVVCGVWHGDRCLCCGGRGYHWPECPESDAGKEAP